MSLESSQAGAWISQVCRNGPGVTLCLVGLKVIWKDELEALMQCDE